MHETALCAAVCPTGAVRIEDKYGQRILHTWNTTAPLHTCPACGEPYAPEPMAFLKEQVPVSPAYGVSVLKVVAKRLSTS